MNSNYWRYLQLFAEGGDGSSSGEGSEGSAAPGVQPAAAGQDELRSRGFSDAQIVKIQKDMARRSARANQPAKDQAQAQQDQQSSATANEAPPTEDQQAQEDSSQEEAPKLADLAKKYPSINQEMQAIVQKRLKGKAASDQSLSQLAPLLSMVASGYGLEIDAEHPDYKPLVDAYMHDPDRYQDMALEKGITSQEAMNQTLQEMQQRDWDNHFTELDRQAQEFQKIVPGFDLRAEMHNPAFARATAPGGMTVEQAYYGLHHAEMQQALAQATAQKTREQVSAAIQSGSMRPVESGSVRQAPSVPTFNYGNASKQQREAFKAELRRAWGRGETVYPGQRR